MRVWAVVPLSLLVALGAACSSTPGEAPDAISPSSTIPLPTPVASTAAPQSAHRYRVQQAVVTRVVDGDTAHVRLTSGAREKIRFIGIDAPESTNRTEPYGQEASRFTGRLLASKTVWLELDVDLRDRYGRLLAYVWLRKPVRGDAAEINAAMVNAILVRDGYAQVSTFPPNVRYVDRFLALQRAARAARRGLWNL